MANAPRSMEGIRGNPAVKLILCLALSVGLLSFPQIWRQESFAFAGEVRDPDPAQGPAPVAPPGVALAGQVRSSNGHEISSGVIVSLETEEHVLIVTRHADADGQFEFESLPNGAFFLLVTAQGFQNFRRPLDELRLSQFRSFVNVSLTPVDQIQTEEASPAVLTDQKAPRKARVELIKGVHALLNGKYSDARNHFQKAIAVYPCYARAQAELAIVLIPSGDLTGAEAALRKSIQCDSGYHPARLVLGQLLNMQKRFGESEKVLREAVRLVPSSWQLYYQLGIADFGLGEYSKAAEEFEEVLSFNPAPPSYFFLRAADAYLAEKAYAKAYAKMQDYLRIEPHGDSAEKVRATIQKMEAEGVLTKLTENAAQTGKD